MDQPSADAVRVPHESLRAFVFEVACKAGIPEDQAAQLAQFLIASDLRGVLSHGSRQIVRYVREIQSGGLNPRPTLMLVKETPASLLMDGDFGLGYFPLYEAMNRAIEKANQHGMAAVVTRNHGHIGAAGIYTRITLAHDLLTFVTSGVQLDLRAGDLVTKAAGGSPMSFSAPTLHEPPVVLDCGVTHDIQGNPPHRDEVAMLAPDLVLRALGFGAICQAWGGLLTGMSLDAREVSPKFPAANQGAMLFTFKISLFADVEHFKREMDEYVRRVRQLEPLKGTNAAHLPGGIEAEYENAYRRDGVPLSQSHQLALETLADELGISVPWRTR